MRARARGQGGPLKGGRSRRARFDQFQIGAEFSAARHQVVIGLEAEEEAGVGPK